MRGKFEVNNKIVGIIGGVGPAATAELFKKIIKNTNAKADNEHIRVIIDNNPEIPDRTRAIEENTLAPVKPIVNVGKELINLGVNFLAIPCVTAHYFYDMIQEQLSVPLINIIEETALFCASRGYKKVGILATTGTYHARIFDLKMANQSIEVMYPDDDDQRLVMHIIYDLIKAGKFADKNLLRSCIEKFKDAGADAIMLGCTELPLVFKQGDFNTCFIDVLDVLAKAIVTQAGYEINRNCSI